MSVSLPWPGAIAVAALAFLGASASAQPRCSGRGPSMRLPSGSASVSFVLLGTPSSSPTASASPAAASSSGPAITAFAIRNPYCMASSPTSISPYMPNTPYASPYSMSTVAGAGCYPSYDSGLGQFGSAEMGYGYALQGMASLTSANAGYWKDIETAALSREGVRQTALDTARRRIEFEAWVDSVRPTAPRMRDREMATDLDTARKAATSTDILSGKALNTLLASIRKSGRLSSGPPVLIEETILKGINLTGGGSPGGAGMLKDGGRLSWPEGLRETAFDEPRKRLADNLELAVQALKDGETVPNSRLKDIKGDLQDMTDRLAANANELLPSQYIEARRYLRELDTASKVLSDRKAVNYFNNTWQARGKNAAELSAYLTREGLLFAPAAPGDELAYRAVYDALRTFEAGLQVAQR